MIGKIGQCHSELCQYRRKIRLHYALPDAVHDGSVAMYPDELVRYRDTVKGCRLLIRKEQVRSPDVVLRRYNYMILTVGTCERQPRIDPPLT